MDLKSWALMVLAMSGIGCANRYYFQDLSSAYTIDGRSERDDSSFPAEYLPRGGKYIAETYSWGAIEFLLSVAEKTPDNPGNLMICSGQQFDMPGQDCSVLYMLGFSVNGYQDGQVVFVYDDGRETAVEYRVMGWNQDVDHFEQGEYNFRVVFHSPYIHANDNKEKAAASFYVNRIMIPLYEGRRPVRMKMISNDRIRIMGMTFSNETVKDADAAMQVKAAAPKPAEIAIFAEPKFPWNRMVGVFTPEFMQKELASAGITSSLLMEADLNNPSVFNNENYKALLLLHGNTFPLDCFEAIKKFKRNGGFLCTTGVPFTHQVKALKNLGHSDKYYPQLGLAGFKSANDRRLCPMPLMQTVSLDHIEWSGMVLNDSQALDISRLPSNTIKDAFLTTGGDFFAGVIYYPDEKSAEVRLQVSPFGNPYCREEKKVQANLMVSMIAYAMDTYAQRPGGQQTSYLDAVRKANKELRADGISAAQKFASPVFLENRGDRICPGIEKKVSRYLVLDISTMPLNCRNLFISAQGLINSGSSETMLYLIHREHDRFWLRWMKDNGYIPSYEQVESAEQLLKDFGLNKAILLDPQITASLNVATTLAGLKGLLIANDYTVVKEFGLQVEEDLCGRWKSNVEAYNWLIDNYWDKINHTVLAFLDSSTHVSMPRDYLVAHNVFTFWVSGPVDSSRPGADQEAEYMFISKVLEKFPVNIPVLGFPYHGHGVGIGEDGGLPLLSEYGKFLLPSDYSSNLSVFTHFPPFQSDKEMSCSRPVELDNGKVYISMIMSDGDNLCTWNDFFHEFWVKMDNRDFPVGWPMSPAMGDVNPVQTDYFYRAKKDIDSLGAAVSGVGYIFGKDFGRKFGDQRTAVFDEFLEITSRYMKRMGFSWLHIMRSGGSGSPITGEYTRILKDMDAMMVGYGKAIGVVDYASSNEYSDGVPVFYMVSSGGTNIQSRIRDIQSILPEEGRRPAFVALIIINWDANPQDFSGFSSQIPSDWTFVSPEQLGRLYKQARK